MMRIGKGYDIHATMPGNLVILGGVEIPAAFALKGHSDADVLMHAITDALLGAIAAEDIGHYFPPSKEENRNRPSKDFLIFARDLVRDRGFVISNIDSNIIAEEPKVGPYRDSIRENIAALLELGKDQIAVKGKTNEKLDSIGRREAIAAEAVVLLSQAG